METVEELQTKIANLTAQNEELKDDCWIFVKTWIYCRSIVIRNEKIVWKHGPHLAEF